MIIQDWQLGELSKIKPLQRGEFNNEWLKKIHEELQETIQNKKNVPILTEEELEKLRDGIQGK